MRLKLLVSLLFFVGIFLSPQAKSLMLSRIPCETRVFETLSDWEQSYRWQPDIVNGDVRSVKSPTKKIGKWVKLSTDADSSTLVKYTALESVVVEFTSPHCNPNLRIRHIKKELLGFDDSKLSSVLKRSSETKSSGIIYIWSPFMNFSIDGIAEAKAIADKLNLEFHLLHDSKIKVTKNTESKQLNSLELMERGAEVHYPSLLFYKDGVLDLNARPGYDSPERLKAYLKKRMEGT